MAAITPAQREDPGSGDRGTPAPPETDPATGRWLPHAEQPILAPRILPRTGTPAGPLTAPTHTRGSVRADALLERARALWPGLHPRELAGTRGDPRRIVRLVARRSTEAPEVLLEMLLHGMDGDR